MNTKTLAGVLCMTLALTPPLLGEAPPAPKEAPGIFVMSFNIRYGTARDGENHWDKRKEFVVETIKKHGAQLIGTQETLSFQRDYLAKHLPEFEHLGVGRTDGKKSGEMMALFYKRPFFTKLDGGHFWLSKTPDKVGSKSWDSSLPRMVTWVKLRYEKLPKQKPILFLNTHFDHRGRTARLESAKLLRKKIVELGEGCSVIVTGDFNSPEGSEPYKALFGEIDGKPSPVVDAYRVANPKRSENEGTFSGFRATNTKGGRIDWVGVSRDWDIHSVKIVRTARDGRTPSDHFPISAVLSRRP